ncbi:class I SAM-dependent methyltransferase [Dermatophilaceae bacterium Sec6.4]
MSPTASRVEDENSPVWARVVQDYAELSSWTDPGEMIVISDLADTVRGHRILDVGVGAGRSAWFLRLLSQDYLGIDYTPEMVQVARRMRPAVHFEVMDARHLVDIADGTCALVIFTHAGLDSLDHQGRAEALSEFRRVLAPDGVLVYSTLNRAGEFYRCGPGPVAPPGQRVGPYSTARFAARAALRPRSHVRGFVNVRRNQSRFADHGDWAVDTMPTHDWSLLVHYVTTGRATAEVEEAGLEVTRLVSREGEDLPMESSDSSTAWFHVVARKASS